MTRYTGPCKLRCPNECDVPEGVTVAMVPPTRHTWSDCFNCPVEECGTGIFVLADTRERTGEATTP